MTETTLKEYEEDAIRELLLYHSVSVVSEDKLVLDDGTELTILPNEGCGGCGNGWYDITELNGCENIITNVSVEADEETSVFQIFVYAENTKINLLTVEGFDNGWYGVGYLIRVTPNKGSDQ